MTAVFFSVAGKSAISKLSHARFGAPPAGTSSTANAGIIPTALPPKFSDSRAYVSLLASNVATAKDAGGLESALPDFIFKNGKLQPVTANHKAIAAFTVHPNYQYTFSCNVATSGQPDEKPLLAAFKFFADSGEALPTGQTEGLSFSAKYGEYKYLTSGSSAVGFKPKAACCRVEIAFTAWDARDFEVRFSKDLTIASVPIANIKESIAHSIEAMIERSAERDLFVLIYTGTKRIGAGNRANRSMMFARVLQKLGILTVYTYSPMPGDVDVEPDDENLLQVPLNVFNDIAARLGAGVKSRQALLLGSMPDVGFARISGLFKSYGWHVVYECRDDWEEFTAAGSGKWFSEIIERYAVSQSERVFCVSPCLARKMSQYTTKPEKVLVSPNATTDDFIAESLPHRRQRERGIYPKEVVIGYFGHLTAHWFDWPAVAAAAHAMPDVRFEIIGFDAPDILVPSNIFYLGAKPHAEIIEIASKWSVGLIPFKPGRLARSVDPIKIYEYLALGLKTVSTPMGQIENYPLTFTYGEFGLSNVLGEALAWQPSQADWTAVDDILADASWEKRLLDLIRHSNIEI